MTRQYLTQLFKKEFNCFCFPVADDIPAFSAALYYCCCVILLCCSCTVCVSLFCNIGEYFSLFSLQLVMPLLLFIFLSLLVFASHCLLIVFFSKVFFSRFYCSELSLFACCSLSTSYSFLWLLQLPFQ